MNRKLLLILLSICSLASCGYQNKIQDIKNQAETAKNKTRLEKEQVQKIVESIISKSSKNELDSLTFNSYNTTLNKLEKSLDNINLQLIGIQNTIDNKAYFNREKYFVLKSRTSFLDSFEIKEPQREAIYNLLNDALKIKSYNLFSLAAYFDPGVYKIKPEIKPDLFKSFAPLIDSFSSFSELHKTVPHRINLVFVGYADESNIAEGSNLYEDLKKHTILVSPSKSDLNIVLSELRAGQMSQNMRELIESKGLPSHLSIKNIGYYYFGRGETLPFPSITDYQSNDSRRRIVVCYWSVLPETTN